MAVAESAVALFAVPVWCMNVSLVLTLVFYDCLLALVKLVFEKHLDVHPLLASSCTAQKQWMLKCDVDVIVMILYNFVSLVFRWCVVAVIVVVDIQGNMVLLVIMTYRFRMCSEPRVCSMWAFVYTVPVPVCLFYFIQLNLSCQVNLQYVAWSYRENFLVKMRNTQY